MLNKYTIIFSLLLLPACDPQPDPIDENLPGTGGFVEIECPGGYLCPPADAAPRCADPDMRLSPGGLCSYPCGSEPYAVECPGLYQSECIFDFMCGTPCETDADCYSAGYGSWASCWNHFGDVATCVDRDFVEPQSFSEGDSTG